MHFSYQEREEAQDSTQLDQPPTTSLTPTNRRKLAELTHRELNSKVNIRRPGYVGEDGRTKLCFASTSAHGTLLTSKKRE